MLSNLFRINFPYGIAKKADNSWYFFNREYLPLGITDQELKGKRTLFDNYGVEYKNLTVKKVLDIVEKNNPIMHKQAQQGDLITIFFYDDGTNPSSTKKFAGYFKILETLAMFDRISS